MKNKTNKKTPENDSIILPEVKDIPGQENIRPPRFREMEDTTISSAGEEGEGILDDLNSDINDTDSISEDSTNVSNLEREILDRSDRPVTEQNKDFERMKLDDKDTEDDLLNEQSNPMDLGEDLDVPGAELDNEDEAIGEEDEENNQYSESQRDQ